MRVQRRLRRCQDRLENLPWQRHKHTRCRQDQRHRTRRERMLVIYPQKHSKTILDFDDFLILEPFLRDFLIFAIKFLTKFDYSSSIDEFHGWKRWNQILCQNWFEYFLGIGSERGRRPSSQTQSSLASIPSSGSASSTPETLRRQEHGPSIRSEFWHWQQIWPFTNPDTD